MLPFQNVSGLAVVKGARRRVPADNREVLAIVFGMAGGTLFLAGAKRSKRRVQAAFGRDTAGNIAVTLQALETGCPRRQLVAARALRGAAQRLVRPRERTRGDLRPAGYRQRAKPGEENRPARRRNPSRRVAVRPLSTADFP